MGIKKVSVLLFSFAAFLLMVLPLFAEQERVQVPIGNSQQKGPADAPVTLIEFLDFQ